jgi:hypothetical protein
MNHRRLEPLSGAPAGAVAAHLGACRDCHRSVGKRSAVKAEPGYRRWLAPGTLSHPEIAGGTICQSCALKRTRRYRPSIEASTVTDARRASVQLTERQLVSLRRMVGACLACGWAPDEGRNPHRCVVESEDDNERTDGG